MPDPNTEGLAQDPRNIVKLLEKSRLFEQLSVDELKKISPALSLQSFPESHILYSDNDANDQVYFLIRGEISILSDGEQVMRLRRLGDMCGDFSLFINQPKVTSEVASTDVDVVCVDLGRIGQCENGSLDDIQNVLFRLFSNMLIDKLAMTISRAQWSGKVDSELARSKEQLREVFEDSTRIQQVRSYFLSNLNLDLRTPTHNVIGITDLLLSTDLNEHQLKYARMIKFSAESLMRIVNNLHVFTRLDDGYPDINQHEFTLEGLIQQSIMDTQTVLAEKTLEFIPRIDDRMPSSLVGDYDRIRLIMFHLLDNAIKFTWRGTIGINAELESDFRDHVIIKITVSDTGIGVSEAFQDHIFEAFTQADTSLTREWSGIGLGLATCRKLVKSMGGEIGYTSQAGIGSDFWFRLPLVKSAERLKQNPQTHQVVNQSLSQVLTRDQALNISNVLIVDHDRVERMVIARMIRQLGYQARALDSGQKAIKATEAVDFDLILLNLNLPDTDGYEIAKKIHTNTTFMTRSETPIIGLVPMGLELNQPQSRDAGIDVILEKPVSIEKLRQVIGEKADPQDMIFGGKNQNGSRELDPLMATVTESLGFLAEAVGDVQPVIRQFIMDYPQKIQRLKNAFDPVDPAEIRRTARALRINCAMFGRTPSTEAAEYIETHATSGRTDNLRQRLVEFEISCSRLIAILSDQLDS